MLLIRVAAFAAILAAAGVIGSTGARSAAADYRFEDVGKPQPSTGGKSRPSTEAPANEAIGPVAAILFANLYLSVARCDVQDKLAVNVWTVKQQV